MKKMNLKRFVTDALLAAMCAVLGLVSIKIGSHMKLTLENVPVIVGALLFGPLDGLLIGGIGSFVYQLLFSGYGLTVTTPLWILPYIASGLFSGLYGSLRGEKMKTVEWMLFLLADGLLVTALNSLALFADSKLFGYWFPGFIAASLIYKVIVAAGKAVVFAFVLPKLLKVLKKQLKSIE